jgi:peptidylprolyl isomerase
VRRFGVILTLLALSLATVAVAAPAAGAQSANDPFAKVKITAAAGAGATAPVLSFPKPFAVKKSAHKVVTEGTGEALAQGDTVTVDFVEVNGRTGKTVGTSYGSQPQVVKLDPASGVPALVSALLATKIGGQALVAVAPKDYAAKLQGAIKTVKKTDTLLFLVTPTRRSLSRATGAAVTPADGLPTVTLDATGKPTIAIPAGVAAPPSLVSQTLITGTGPAVTAGQTLTVNYTGIVYGSGKQFDSSWDRGQPAQMVIGNGKVIPGWDKGLVGQTVGSQVLLVIPPADGYGTSGNTQAGITGTDTLVFVVDILDAY